MNNEINIYCDESAHLENDNSDTMVIGAIYCRHVNSKKISNEIKRIKLKHGYRTDYELKWTKITKGNVPLVFELLTYFFQCNGLRFRGYIIDKTGLDHEAFKQDHDTWYYKMFYR